MPQPHGIQRIRIGLASPQQVLQWSSGEVRKPETINYRTFKPERDGLFCERIFGPTKDWECHCGRYRKIKYKGIICDKCGVQVTRSQVRRRRMGHITLAAPVAHIWYLKAVPSPVGLLLDIPPKALEEVTYFAKYIVTHRDGTKIRSLRSEFEKTVEEQIASVHEECQRHKEENRRRCEEQIAANPELTDDEKEHMRRAVEQRSQEEDKNLVARVQEVKDTLPLLLSLAEKERIQESEYRHLMALIERTGQRLEQRLGGIFRAAPGGEALKTLLSELDLEEMSRDLRKQVDETTGAKRQKAIKRLSVVNWFRRSRNRPEWMILEVLPVLPPDLRPMVQLDGGRFATSDVNDLYRRVINRNNRLKKITEIRAPESIVNHEKRLLQEAVDALIDNSRRRRPVTGPNKRELKSLTDMLKGKEGRFRKNLLGKRVDYSGRSVIVIGPELELEQCGLPREMALELFKPMVIRKLYEQDATRSIKKTKRMVERLEPDVWDALEEVVEGHPVLLNRAPTLHRLGIQAFIPKLVDGRALQIHPLVCHAFNADFDGDQMPVHVPLSIYAQVEALALMLSTRNLFKPADSSPIVAPLYDIVLGCHYLSQEGEKPLAAEDIRCFANAYEARLAFHLRTLDMHSPVKVRLWRVSARAVGERFTLPEDVEAQLEDACLTAAEENPLATERAVRLNLTEVSRQRLDEDLGLAEVAQEVASGLRLAQEAGRLPAAGQVEVQLERYWVQTTVGRVILNSIIPGPMRNYSQEFTKKQLSELVIRAHKLLGAPRTVRLLEDLKRLGFTYATRAGITIALSDMDIPAQRDEITQQTQEQVDRIADRYQRGFLSSQEREDRVRRLWLEAHDRVARSILENISRFNPIYMMVNSGARANIRQVSQLAGMRGLMSDPFGRLIEDLPVTSNFREGLRVLEYFVSTHGARKGLADTALRTADAGYLTRKLVDVAQEVVIREQDCGTTESVVAKPIYEEKLFCPTCGGEDLHRLGVCQFCGDRLPESTNNEMTETLKQRIVGRTAAEQVVDSATGEVLVEANQLISEEAGDRVEAAGIRQVPIRSLLTCRTRRGCCAMCYGLDLAMREPVQIGEAVGVIAGQSIGEPGTQLTMRTFHIGGVAAQYLTGVADVRKRKQENLRQLQQDIERGLVGLGTASGRARTKATQDVLKLLEDPVMGILRVVELFEARKPKGQAIITDFDGVVERIEVTGLRHVIISHEAAADQCEKEIAAEAIIDPKSKKKLVARGTEFSEKLAAKIRKEGLDYVYLQKAYMVPYRGYLTVSAGHKVKAGDRLTLGPLNPSELLATKGIRAAQEYLLQEVQAVYRPQGVDINDKHIEVIIAQMFRKRRIDDPGASEFLPGQLVDVFEFEEENARLRTAGGKPATGSAVLLGITESALATDSFLSAASFQKTTKVLTEAAIQGKQDPLFGLKENVIIGRLVPAGTGFETHARWTLASDDELEKAREMATAEESGLPFDLGETGRGIEEESRVG